MGDREILAELEHYESDVGAWLTRRARGKGRGSSCGDDGDPPPRDRSPVSYGVLRRVQNPIIVLKKGDVLRVYLGYEGGPSIHINSDGKVWRGRVKSRAASTSPASGEEMTQLELVIAKLEEADSSHSGGPLRTARFIGFAGDISATREER